MRYTSVQICSILLLLTILFLSDRKKPFKLSGMRAFQSALHSVLLSLVLNITSVIMIYAFRDTPDPVADVICKLYLISLMTVGLTMYRYTLTGLFGRDKRIIVLKGTGWAFALLGVGNILFSHIEKKYDEAGDVLYISGESMTATYISMAALIVLTMAATVIMRDRIYRVKAFNVQTCSIIMLGCGTLQIVDRRLQLISFAMALSAAIIYEKVENPNRYTDTESELYNAAAFKAYLSEGYELRRPMYCLRVALNTGHKELTLEEVNLMTERFSRFLEKEDGIAFRTNSYTFALVAEDAGTVERAMNDICDFLTSVSMEMPFAGIRSAVYMFTDQSLFHNAEEMISSYYKIKSYRISHTEEIELVNVDRKVLASILRVEQIKKDISAALEENRVEVFYQPIYDIKKNRFTSAEALVRIRSREGELIPPSDFIPVAEETGLIVPLGERIFSLVCAFLGSDRKPKSLKYVEVNLSAVQCRRSDLYEVFRQIMEKEGVKPDQVNMEITETVQLNTSRKITKMLEKFRKDGVRFSLDDFGTGNSNIDYIANVPVISIVKFDHMMTQGFFTNERIRASLPHVIRLIKEMDLKIVCEGVETEDQLNTMKAFGIDFIQGYYFSKPIPEAEFIEFINENNKKNKDKEKTKIPAAEKSAEDTGNA